MKLAIFQDFMGDFQGKGDETNPLTLTTLWKKQRKKRPKIGPKVLKYNIYWAKNNRLSVFSKVGLRKTAKFSASQEKLFIRLDKGAVTLSSEGGLWAINFWKLTFKMENQNHWADVPVSLGSSSRGQQLCLAFLNAAAHPPL